MIKVVIVEDDMMFVWKLEQMLEELGQYEVIGTYRDTISFKQGISHHTPDLILMDVRLETERSGLDLAVQLIDRNIPILFLTQYADEKLYEEAFQLLNTSFLVKPFHKFTLDAATHLLIPEKFGSLAATCLSIKIGRKEYPIHPKEVCWVESTRNYCTIQTEQKQFVIKRSLKSLKAILPEDSFIFIHKSFLVKKDLIKAIDYKAQTVLVGKDTLPLGRTYVKFLHKLFEKIG